MQSAVSLWIELSWAQVRLRDFPDLNWLDKGEKAIGKKGFSGGIPYHESKHA